MAWNDSFEEMQAADLETTFLGGEFAASIELTTVSGETFTVTGPAVEKMIRLDQGQMHEKTETMLEVMIPVALSESANWSPHRKDSVSYGGKTWDLWQVKGKEGGAITALFRNTAINMNGKPPSNL